MYRREIKRDGKVHRYVCDRNSDSMLNCQFTDADMTFAKFVCKFYARTPHQLSNVDYFNRVIKLLDHLDIPHEFIDRVETTSSDAMKLVLIEKWLDERERERLKEF
jgi:hypothetical protein